LLQSNRGFKSNSRAFAAGETRLGVVGVFGLTKVLISDHRLGPLAPFALTRQ
jgi:hypothetical protein